MVKGTHKIHGRILFTAINQFYISHYLYLQNNKQLRIKNNLLRNSKDLQTLSELIWYNMPNEQKIARLFIWPMTDGRFSH